MAIGSHQSATTVKPRIRMTCRECGGPPCQGYSISGKRDVYDACNSLVFEYARFIVELQPKSFVMEEVPNILNMVTPEGFPLIDQFNRIIEDGGFSGFNALQKAMGAAPGAKGALRGKGTAADMRKAGTIGAADDEEDAFKAAQTDLFG